MKDTEQLINQLKRENAELKKQISLLANSEQLTEINFQLSSVINGADVGTWQWNTISNTVVYNERWANILGYTLDELKPLSHETWKSKVHPDDLGVTNLAIKDHREGRKEFYEVEYRMKHKDGHWIWILDRGKIYRYTPEGKPELIAGTHTDITNRKNTELALQESEARLKGFMDYVPALILIKDNDLRPIYCNDQFKKMFPFDQWFGKTPHELFETDVANMMVAKDREVFETGSTAYQEEWTDKFGKQHIYFTQKFRIDLTNGKPLLGAIITDITDRVHTEEALHESEEIFAQFMEHSPVFVFFKDENIRAIRLSSNFEQMLGRPIDEILGKDMTELFPQSLAESMIAVDKNILFEGKAITIEEELNDRHYSTIKFPISVKGKPRYLAGFTIDTTERYHASIEREKMQLQLAQLQKMESIGRLAGGVAHDFNNMLQAIIGHTELAMENLETDNPLFNDIQEIQNAAVRSADLTRQLLAFARKQNVIPKLLDLNETVSSMLKMLQRLIGENIELSWKPGHRIGNIFIDPSQLDQILANLTVNARDAITGTGSIAIETEPVLVTEEFSVLHQMIKPGNYAVLSISDTGCGIRNEDIEHIFEPFFTTKALGQGTGLGLATVYGIVNQNHGFIDLISKAGGGSTFKIYLPIIAREVGSEQSVIDKSLQIGKGETILIVEDESAILLMVQSQLQQLGYNVLTATCPSEAISITTENPSTIQLLITDVIMPEMNGIELADTLMKLNPDIKYLLISGYTADILEKNQTFNYELNFLPKPFSLKTLSNKVRKILDLTDKS